MGQEFEKELRNYLHNEGASPRPEAMHETIEKSMEIISNIGFRRHRSIGAIVLEQIRFIGWRTWLLQAIVFCIALAFEISCLSVHSLIRLIPALMSLISVFVALSMLPFLYRAKQYSMLETESSAWLSGRRLVFIRAIIFTACDIMCALVMFLTALTKSDVSAIVLFFSALLPCLVISVGLLMLVRKENLTDFGVKYVFLCTGAAIGFAFIYCRTLPAWCNSLQLVLTVGLLVTYAVQIIRGLRSSEGVIFA